MLYALQLQFNTILNISSTNKYCCENKVAVERSSVEQVACSIESKSCVTYHCWPSVNYSVYACSMVWYDYVILYHLFSKMFLPFWAELGFFKYYGGQVSYTYNFAILHPHPPLHIIHSVSHYSERLVGVIGRPLYRALHLSLQLQPQLRVRYLTWT